MNTETRTQAPRLLRSRPEAKAMLGGIGTTTLDALLNEGLLRRVKVGRRAMVTDESIRRYIEVQANEMRVEP